MKQTAVGYLKEKYEVLIKQLSSGRVTVFALKDFTYEIEQAKEMERQQIIDARQSHPLQMQKLGWKVCVNDGEQYFNETYGGEK